MRLGTGDCCRGSRNARAFTNEAFASRVGLREEAAGLLRAGERARARARARSTDTTATRAALDVLVPAAATRGLHGTAVRGRSAAHATGTGAQRFEAEILGPLDLFLAGLGLGHRANRADAVVAALTAASFRTAITAGGGHFAGLGWSHGDSL